MIIPDFLPDPSYPHLDILEKNGVVWLQSPLLAKLSWLDHGMSTRLGGVSGGYYSSMNFSFKTDDLRSNVIENYERFSRAVGIDPGRIVRQGQVHSDNVRIVEAEHRPAGINGDHVDFPGTDGMMTDVPGLTLFAYSADCPVILFADPTHHAAAVCHSGWRGTVSRISRRTLSLMNERYGTDPAEVLVFISPSICRSCFEVEYDVISRVEETFPPEICERVFTQTSEVKYHLDLWELNRLSLTSLGVSDENITMPGFCSMCNHELLFSHRYTHGKRGLSGVFISVRE